MYGSLHNARQMLLHIETIQLPMKMVNMDTLDIICYDFVSQLLSLLHGKELMTSKDLVLNPDDPFSIYEPTGGWLGHAMSDSVY
jgi:hypothetical protein